MITKASLNDLPQIMSIITHTIEEMQTYNNTQWDKNYPQEKDFRNDILQNHLYVARNGDTITGFICINQVEPLEYAELTWSTSEPCLVIHRMAINPTFRNQGIATSLMQFAEDVAHNANINYLKTDTYSINTKMNALFKKCGYTLVGDMYFLGKAFPFYCYEKTI